MINHNSILQLTDSTTDVFTKMSKGNPGALRALMELSTAVPNGFLMILLFDSWGIYGSDIYVLWSDICGRDARKMACVLKATQMGEFRSSTLKNACGRQDYSGKDLIPVDEFVLKFSDKI